MSTGSSVKTYFHLPVLDRGAYYRIIQPFRYLSKKGYDVGRMKVLDEEHLRQGDVFVFYKYASPFTVQGPLASRIRAAFCSGDDKAGGHKAMGDKAPEPADQKVLVYDLDEMLLGLPPYHRAFNLFFGDTDATNTVKTTLAEASIVTVPSAYMADALRDYAPRIEVVPFYVSQSLLSQDSERNISRDAKAKLGLPPESVVIGWAGGNCHLEDLLMLKSPIEQIVKRFRNTQFVLVGDDPGIFDLPRDRKRTLIPRSVEEYFACLDLIDIGLAPLVENLYNRCKSNLKMLEYGMKGIPVVASKVLPYLRTAEEGAAISFAEGRRDWEDQITDLLEDEAKRVGEGWKLRAFVEENYLLEDKGCRYEKLLFGQSSEEFSGESCGESQGEPTGSGPRN